MTMGGDRWMSRAYRIERLSPSEPARKVGHGTVRGASVFRPSCGGIVSPGVPSLPSEGRGAEPLSCGWCLLFLGSFRSKRCRFRRASVAGSRRGGKSRPASGRQEREPCRYDACVGVPA
jgi:hypothetical protein